VITATRTDFIAVRFVALVFSWSIVHTQPN
jgi:hypothetical protein